VFDDQQQLAERLRRIAEAALPWHDRVANVTETGRRQVRRSRLPAETDGTAKFIVPQPVSVTRKAWDLFPIRKHDRRSLGFPVDESFQIAHGIDPHCFENFASSVGAARGVGRPALFESGDEARQVFSGWADEVHDWWK